MTRPEDLIYAVDELPPWPRLIFLGAQHAVLMSVYLVLIVIVFRRADAFSPRRYSRFRSRTISLRRAPKVRARDQADFQRMKGSTSRLWPRTGESRVSAFMVEAVNPVGV